MSKYPNIVMRLAKLNNMPPYEVQDLVIEGTFPPDFKHIEEELL